ncbi:hypothetical protein FEM48_Zijuj02G0160800 [Ziziphus jujuba var. spinosa]|nr:hypothetical protein FEM48_Zijuj02G0160800 [Ziziphus jujuba var. spinosa]
MDAWIREAEEASKLVEDLENKYKNKNPEQWRLRDAGLSKLLELGVKLDRLESLLRNPPTKPVLTKEDVEFRWKMLSDIQIRTKALVLNFSSLPSPSRQGSLPIVETKTDCNEALDGLKLSSSKEDLELLKPLISEDVTFGQVEIKPSNSHTSWKAFWKTCGTICVVLWVTAFLFGLLFLCMAL